MGRRLYEVSGDTQRLVERIRRLERRVDVLAEAVAALAVRDGMPPDPAGSDREPSQLRELDEVGAAAR
jgi:hypothetical protein